MKFTLAFVLLGSALADTASSSLQEEDNQPLRGLQQLAVNVLDIGLSSSAKDSKSSKASKAESVATTTAHRNTRRRRKSDTGTTLTRANLGTGLIEGDLEMRFNKVVFEAGSEPDWMPMVSKHYPMQGDVAEILKKKAIAAAVMTADDPEISGVSIAKYIKHMGGLPAMPNKDSNAPFWDELREVIKVRHLRLASEPVSSLFTFPDLWSHRDIHDVAEAVHDEYPGSLQTELMQWLWEQDAPLDNDIVPYRSNPDFVGYQIRMADLNTWAIGTVSPINFGMKWYAGRPRPEEVAYRIATKEFGVDYGVPDDIVEEILAMDLEFATNFTAYPEGSPMHPSWPAMHSAASSASFWIAVLLDLTEEQYCEARRVDYAVSYARTVAGVHYPTDNIVGLNLGQRILAERLAEHMATRYGSDPRVVQAKIDKLRFDWADFDPNSCKSG